MRLGLGDNEVEREVCKLGYRRKQGLSRLSRCCSTTIRLSVAVFRERRRENEKPVGLHPQECDSAAHVLEAAVGLAPAKLFTYSPRELSPIENLQADLLPDPRRLFDAESPAAISVVQSSLIF